ncbi:MoaD/ThiS family protein [Bordetella holmesii]|nr:MoaD/ThiS family protein [Bordetella holmesii]AMD46342.1 molybdopterin converting factor [Bordetella holmesii H558]EWM41970.1 thiS family protein [Bordetella holmesii 41130]AOB35235.1 molybdopterin synthase sulfur carrier subunit [Bordetella holmesii]AUL19224.1 molybdopterin synthase sulfur carrier subunit [Bordetella holmesii]AUL22558.1 molybdopterin synthase sulfur carrier subunit [Bordetella holmesii]
MLYFARVAELLGKRAERLPLPQPANTVQLVEDLAVRYPQLSEANRLRLAVNQTHVKGPVALAADDEVAVFEPVTGG